MNNEQRKIIYSQRDEILAENTLQEYVEEMHREVMQAMIANFIPPESIHDQWDVEGLENALRIDLGIELPVQEWLEQDRRLDEEGLVERISDEVIARYRQRRAQMGDESAAMLERHFVLNSLDRHWKIIWLQWIIYVKVSTYVAMRKKILSRNIRKKHLTCS